MPIGQQAGADAVMDADVTDTQAKGASVASRGFVDFIVKETPIFFWLALFSLVLRVIEASAGFPIIRTNFVPPEHPGLAITPIEGLLYLLMFFGFREIFVVSKPGVDQSGQAWTILVLGIIQIVIFALAVGAKHYNVAPSMHMFATTEGLGFALTTLTCGYYTYRINVRSMQRSFVNG